MRLPIGSTTFQKQNVNGAAARARFRQNFERHSRHKRFSKLEKSWKNGFALCVSPYGIYDLVSWTNDRGTLTACRPQHIFTFVILNGGFVIKINTSDLNASEFIGNSWQNTHKSKSVKSENVQNDKKVKKLKSIGNSWQNSQEDVLKRISSSRQKIASDQNLRRSHIIYNKYYYNRPFSRSAGFLVPSPFRTPSSATTLPLDSPPISWELLSLFLKPPSIPCSDMFRSCCRGCHVRIV